MFARVATYEVPPDRLGDALRSFQGAVQRIQELEGISEAYVLVSWEEGRALTMTVWGSQHAMESSRDTASRLRREAAREAEGSVVSVAEYEVALHEVAGGTA